MDRNSKNCRFLESLISLPYWLFAKICTLELFFYFKNNFTLKLRFSNKRLASPKKNVILTKQVCIIPMPLMILLPINSYK